MDLITCNVGNSPTFVRNLSRSIIDVTFATSRSALAIRSWKVLPLESLSLYRYITFSIGDTDKLPEKSYSKSWNTSNFDNDRVYEKIRNTELILSEGSAEEMAEEIFAFLSHICDKT